MIRDILFKNKVDKTILINSRIFQLKKIGFIKKDDISSFEKNIAIISGVFINILRNLAINLFYFYNIYLIISFITKNSVSNIYTNLYIVLSVFGALINSKILKTSNTKYHSVILLNMDTKSYTLSDIFSYISLSFVFHFISLFILRNKIGFSISNILILTSFMVLIKILGEIFNLLYFKKKKNTFLNNTILYFSILIILLLSGILLSYFNYFISFKILFYANLILLFPCICSIIYLFMFKDYKYFYKRLINITNYKDAELDISLAGRNYSICDFKNPYSFINTIFIKRHSGVILSPIYRNTIIITFVLLLLIALSIYNSVINRVVGIYIFKYFNILFLLIYLLNKSSFITKLFFNSCDKSLTTYSFYNEKDNLYGLLSERLKSFTLINMLPVLPIAILFPILLTVTGKISVLTIILLFFAIILLSIFFTIHFIGMYYLLHPYDKDSKIVDLRYQIINSVIVILLFIIIGVHVKLSFLLGLIISFSVIYISIILFLLYKKNKACLKSRL